MNNVFIFKLSIIISVTALFSIESFATHSMGPIRCAGVVMTVEDRSARIYVLKDRLKSIGIIDPSYITFEMATDLGVARQREIMRRTEAKFDRYSDRDITPEVIDEMMYPLTSQKLVSVFVRAPHEGHTNSFNFDLDPYIQGAEGRMWIGESLSASSYQAETQADDSVQNIMVHFVLPANFLEENPNGSSEDFQGKYRIKREKLKEHGLSLSVFVNGLAVIPKGMRSFHKDMWLEDSDLPPVPSNPYE